MNRTHEAKPKCVDCGRAYRQSFRRGRCKWCNRAWKERELQQAAASKPPFVPTDLLPSVDDFPDDESLPILGKAAIIQARVAAGLPAHHPDDRRLNLK